MTAIYNTIKGFSWSVYMYTINILYMLETTFFNSMLLSSHDFIVLLVGKVIKSFFFIYLYSK